MANRMIEGKGKDLEDRMEHSEKGQPVVHPHGSVGADPKGSDKVQADITKLKGVRADKLEQAKGLEFSQERDRVMASTDFHCQHCAATGFMLGRDAAIRVLEEGVLG